MLDARTLRSVADVYRTGRWPDDRKHDEARVAALGPLLRDHGAALAGEMARVTETPWPPQPIRVEVSALAGPVGAFTSDDPPRIAIASDDTRADGPAGLEILFHEASHVLDGKIMSIIDAAAAAQHRASPPGLWHAVLFYTAGELVARRLGAGYVPYGIKQGLYERAPGWSDYLRALRDAYTPHLDGKATLDASLQAVVRAVP